MIRELKFIKFNFNESSRTLKISGNNDFVKGEIVISKRYFFSLESFLNRIFRKLGTKYFLTKKS